MSALTQFLADRWEQGGFSTEDVLASFLPLAREVLETHAAGFVAPLEGIGDLQVDGVRIWFEESRRQPIRRHESALRRVASESPAAVEIIAETRRVTEIGDESPAPVNLAIADGEAAITRPVYLPRYLAWEHRLEHHDPLTDVFSLGLILASLSCGFDFHEADDLERFVTHRRNLFAVAPNVHPVLAQTIVQMTELDRRRRATDLGRIVVALENYRDQSVDFDVELAKIPGFASEDTRTKQTVVLRKLRERLFDVSRRNRLLHFQATQQSVNLTHASVPLSFDVTSIRPDQIFVWNAQRQQDVADGKSISLNKALNFAEALYLPSVLDRLLAEANRDRAEYGFAQLRLVACFLRWTNLKEKPIQRYDSPLLLLPVELKKQKRIRDFYALEPQATEAEVNPVVRFEFKRLYDINLPATIDLCTTGVDEFYDYLTTQIASSRSAVTLQKIDRPRMALIHDRARRKLDQYRRRARLAGRGVRQFLNLDYSYDPANYHPLGIKLFSARVRAPESKLRTIIEERPRPRSYAMPADEPPVVEKEKTFFSLEEGEANPYTWQFDLCSVTLANFKYRRMSLVSDYDALIEQHATNPAFDATFSLTPRPERRVVRDAPPLAERFDVVPCDPTQATAVGEARAGESYIIQGPPGTGKSQTITNLIADFVARGKRVLFVCEKRAAIDVVYARLRQRGLSDLCCLIHDSQTDKKAFVADLKQTYESLLDDAPLSAPPVKPRAELVREFTDDLAPLEFFDAAMQAAASPDGLPTRELLDRAIELADHRPELTPVELERLPGHAAWHRHRDKVRSFLDVLTDLQPDGVIARHPLSLLSPRVALLDRPLETVTAALTAMREHFARLHAAQVACGVPAELWNTLNQTDELVACLKPLAPLAENKLLPLIDSRNESAQKFAADAAQLCELEVARAKAAEEAQAWKQRLPAADLDRALQLALNFEESRFAWLRLDWWRLRRILHRSYDFRSHVVAPRWSQVLALLRRLLDAERAVQQAADAIRGSYGIAGDVSPVVSLVLDVRQSLPHVAPPLRRLLAALVKSPRAHEFVARVMGLAPLADVARRDLQTIVDCIGDRPTAELREAIERAFESLDQLPDFLQGLGRLAALPAELSSALTHFPLPPAALEAASAEKSLADAFRADRTLHRFNGQEHRRQVARLGELYETLLDANAEEIRRRVRDRFRERVRVSSLSAAQLDASQKDFKKSYSRGRRDLEHEFGKSTRFKPIRDLASGDSGAVLRDLKPVWLMSPLSVSDTLPLDDSRFDVVIFDEASQITLEEAVPSLFRAAQAIIVGDEMQLPPTAFFSAKPDEDDEELLVEDDGELVRYELESASFLNHAARNLPSTMLGWHYRSRSESLISFSNWAFYEGRLLTAPEEHLAAVQRTPLMPASAEEAPAMAAATRDRPISFHWLGYGVYEQRRNSAEAEYIAQLVRGLLHHGDGRTIGVVAFSEAQQAEIEDALAQLAQDDPSFRDQYDAELQREEDGQFVGLLVKNLENIQGEERDVIILSVCYGRDAAGKMRMNFGPINIAGGEKRLNVAFSRAKHHMAVVSSIRADAITNDHNEGANCFKNYLRYAEAISTGQADGAARVLHGLCRWHELDDGSAAAPSDIVAEQLSAALVRRGFLVERAVGQSHFRCDLAVRRPGDAAYCLGVLVDNAAYYEQSDIMERDVMRPKLLRDFGWKVCQVFAKDWYLDRQRVVDRVVRLVDGEADADLPEAASPSGNDCARP